MLELLQRKFYELLFPETATPTPNIFTIIFYAIKHEQTDIQTNTTLPPLNPLADS